MFEKLRIKEHMEVADANGQHIGTIDEVDGDTIKLTRSDSTDGQHHFIPFDAVDRIDDNRVYLKVGAVAEARSLEGQQQSGTQQAFGSQGHINPNEYSPSTSGAPGSAASDQPLFGTSGSGTGFGGSGAGQN